GGGRGDRGDGEEVAVRHGVVSPRPLTSSFELPRLSPIASTPPTDARRRWPSPRPGALPASQGSPSAREGGAPAPRAAPAGPGRDRRVSQQEAAPRAGAPVRTPEVELAVRLSIHLVALLVDRALVPATEQREVRERGRAAVRPVTDVMPLAEREAAAGKAAAPVPVVERPAKRWGDGPGAGADLDDLTIRGVPHHHPARVARLGSASRAAASACTSRAPTSGASRPRRTTIPSSP